MDFEASCISLVSEQIVGSPNNSYRPIYSMRKVMFLSTGIPYPITQWNAILWYKRSPRPLQSWPWLFSRNDLAGRITTPLEEYDLQCACYWKGVSVWKMCRLMFILNGCSAQVLTSEWSIAIVLVMFPTLSVIVARSGTNELGQGPRYFPVSLVLLVLWIGKTKIKGWRNRRSDIFLSHCPLPVGNHWSSLKKYMQNLQLNSLLSIISASQNGR